MTARLLIDIPPGQWAFTYVLDSSRKHVAGSSFKSDIKLPSRHAAEVHATFSPEGNGWVLYDQQGGGTSVNGKVHNEGKLSHGDVVRMGECELVFQQPEANRDNWDKAKNAISQQEAKLVAAVASGQPQTRLTVDDLGMSRSQLFTTEDRINATPSPDKVKELPADPAQDIIWVAKQLSEILADVLARPGSRDEAYQLMLTRLRTIMEADNGFVMLVDEEANRWVIRAYTGDTATWSDYAKTHPVPMTVTNRAYQQKTVISNAMEGSHEEDASPSMLALNVQSYIAVPLLEGGKRRGVLYFDTRNPAKEFSPRDVRLLEAIGSYILVIENTRN